MIRGHDKIIDDELKEISRKYKDYKKLVDFGCGRGERTLDFVDFGREVVGLDYVDDRLVETKNKVKFHKVNFFVSGLPDNFTEMVLCFDVIEHMEEPGKLLKEISRVMKPKGVLILSTPNRNRLTNWPLLKLGLRKYPLRLSKVRDDYPDYWHLTEYSEEQLKKLVEDNGFKILEWRKIFYGLPGRKGIDKLAGWPFYHNHILVLEKKN
jgi:2-polyprenyl-3-methyl-5-hydroxy-6-metoxy-1,4-benzoquinol methylase